MKEKILTLTKKDFKIETMRGHGREGQHRNTTDSAVRISHELSSTSAYSCDERSQHQNKRKAFLNLVNQKKFRNWLKLEIARKLGELDKIEKEVNEMMNPENLKIETF